MEIYLPDANVIRGSQSKNPGKENSKLVLVK